MALSESRTLLKSIHDPKQRIFLRPTMASSSSSTGQREYDVFISFRGEDTRKTFLSHLYESLRRKGLDTFKDDRELKKGDSISDKLAGAIRDSRFAIVVISEHYASSRWCLEELRTIMELQSMEKMTVVPIFYGVDPSDVRNQRGRFAESFERYRDSEMAEKVQKWREALTQVACLSGADSRNYNEEVEMINDIVGGISSRLLHMRPMDVSNLVGMDAHMQSMIPLLNIESKDEVRMIGLWGMPGIGKTTIAKYLYYKFASEFPAQCFMEKISETFSVHGLLYLQEQLLSNILHEKNVKFWSVESGSREIERRLASQKVFVVLDDVNSVKQLHALSKKTSWFGQGSRIIITTRDKGLLNSCGVQRVYDVKCLEDDDALQIFKQHAFEGGHCPSDAYEELSIHACKLARGLPSALEEYGSHLCGRSQAQWKDALSRFERAPYKSVTEIFKTSYEGLDTPDKRVFLHVACLFNGDPVQHVAALLGEGNRGVNHTIEILAEKSLIGISTDGCINMHDLIEQTGREIVRQESKYDPRKQRILWDHGEILPLLACCTGTNRNEGIALHMCEIPSVWSVKGSVFEPMYNLRFLKLYRHAYSRQPRLHLTTNIVVLPHNLRLLHWDEYPMETLPSGFYPGSLVELNLRYSNIKILWKDTPEDMNLRRLDLTGSKNLKELPDLSKANNLEELRIKGCTKLKLTPESIGNFSRLHVFEHDDLPNSSPGPIPVEGHPRTFGPLLEFLLGCGVIIVFLFYVWFSFF